MAEPYAPSGNVNMNNVSATELVRQTRLENRLNSKYRVSVYSKPQRYATTVRKPPLRGAAYTRHQGAHIFQPQRRKGLLVGSG